MSQPTQHPCVVLREDKSFCRRDPIVGAPFPLCFHHLSKVQAFLTDRVDGPSRMSHELDLARQRQEQRATEAHLGVVYYVRVGELIKIGTTKQAVHDRLSDLPPDKQLLATEPGGFEMEGRRHRQFWKERHCGEWFRPSPDLWRHITEVRDSHGAPAELPSRASA